MERDDEDGATTSLTFRLDKRLVRRIDEIASEQQWSRAKTLQILITQKLDEMPAKATS
jgi:predicted transcriptional regulator